MRHQCPRPFGKAISLNKRLLFPFAWRMAMGRAVSTRMLYLLRIRRRLGNLIHPPLPLLLPAHFRQCT